VIGVFKQKNPGNIVMLFILGILVKLPLFFGKHPVILREHDGVLYKWIVDFIHPFVQAFPLAPAFIAFFLLFLQAHLLNRFITTNRLMSRANSLPGMAYMLISSLLPELNYLSAPLIASGLYLYIFIILFRSYNQKITLGDLFNCGLIIGVASFIFVPSIIFITFILFALIILRPFKLNEWVLMILGVTTPYYLYFAYLFLNDKTSFFKHIIEMPRFGIIQMSHAGWISGGIFLILLPLLAGIYYAQALSGRNMIHVRKAWQLFGIYILMSLLSVLFYSGSGNENWVLILLPVAAFHGYGYFNAEWKLYPYISFWLSIAFIAALQLFGNMW
jgi:hypothetical protein